MRAAWNALDLLEAQMLRTDMIAAIAHSSSLQPSFAAASSAAPRRGSSCSSASFNPTSCVKLHNTQHVTPSRPFPRTASAGFDRDLAWLSLMHATQCSDPHRRRVTATVVTQADGRLKMPGPGALNRHTHTQQTPDRGPRS